MRFAVSYLSLQFLKLQLRFAVLLVVVVFIDVAVAVVVAEVFCTLSCKAHNTRAENVNNILCDFFSLLLRLLLVLVSNLACFAFAKSTNVKNTFAFS